MESESASRASSSQVMKLFLLRSTILTEEDIGMRRHQTSKDLMDADNNALEADGMDDERDTQGKRD